MAFSISQILATSFSAILADNRKPENQWAESSFMRELERQGMLKRIDFGPTLEAPLDVRRNPGAGFLDTDLQPVSVQKTDVMSAASYTPAQLAVPIVWSKMDEVVNPTENQKISLVKGLVANSLDSHDDLIEQAIFATSTSGFLGFLTHIPDNGQSSDGGIDSAVEAVWRSQNATYVDDTDVEAAMTTVWNACTKGSGSKLMPTFLVSDGPTQALFEGTQQTLQRYADQDFKAGAKTLIFKTGRYVFSPYGGTRIYFGNPKSFNLLASKAYFRELSETDELEGANGFSRKVYSALQSVTNNRSRLGVVHL
jgi:hypothetical protein